MAVGAGSFSNSSAGQATSLEVRPIIRSRQDRIGSVCKRSAISAGERFFSRGQWAGSNVPLSRIAWHTLRFRFEGTGKNRLQRAGQNTKWKTPKECCDGGLQSTAVESSALPGMQQRPERLTPHRSSSSQLNSTLLAASRLRSLPANFCSPATCKSAHSCRSRRLIETNCPDIPISWHRFEMTSQLASDLLSNQRPRCHGGPNTTH